MPVFINWWDIGKNQNLHLSRTELTFLVQKALDNYGSLHELGKEIGHPTGIYSKLKYCNQGITVNLLMKILDSLEVQYSEICKEPTLVGLHRFAQIKFPFMLSPVFGQILAHTFFDGYADDYIFRYSNYDRQIRKEFVASISKCLKIELNIPKNVVNDIDVPVFLPRFLKSYFEINSFKGGECRIPKRFIELVAVNSDFGWFFLKGAFLDEGTISGKQIWIVRGIKNRPLAEGLVKLSNILGLHTEIKETKLGYYSVKLLNQSYSAFYHKIDNKFFVNVDKWGRIRKKISSFKKYKSIKQKSYIDCKNILSLAKQKGNITLKNVCANLNMSKSSCYFKLNCLVYFGNLGVVKVGKENIYVFQNDVANSEININEIRRNYNWR